MTQLRVFGNDYPTVDRADVHVHNLGTGRVMSVLELVEVFEEENDIQVLYDIVKRRLGDIAY